MTGIIKTYGGESYELPPLTKWRVSHTSGEACGDFEVSFLYSDKLFDLLDAAIRFSAYHEGETVFTGVVDELKVKYEADGLICTLSGRDMAALLLDNQVGAASFGTARLDDIIDRYVKPMGIQTIITAPVAAINQYSVSAGASRYDALADFTFYAAGLWPWFDCSGRLMIGRPADYRFIHLKEPVAASFRDKRYGVASHVNYMGTEFSGAFAVEGGVCTRYIPELSDKTYKTGERLAQLDLATTALERRTLTVAVPKVFAAMPYDFVKVTGFDPMRAEKYEVVEAESTYGPSGQMCVLTLR